MIEDGFWIVLVYILMLFCLNIVHCLQNLDSAARWLIAWGLGAYIFPRGNFEKMEHNTRVWGYILICSVNFLHKNNIMSQPGLAMPPSICIMEKMMQYSELGCIF